ncbi:hypothetical protein Q5P01_010517 [Channa striata]|uniref:Uncharacterized protein n=1 Tax=Channa striata TaxID=64152 RepID=A0AA88N1N7_CHASR|nr:hypothetical protein Q5P01_010517 [Channa striata]
MLRGLGEGGWGWGGVNEADCACVSEAVVLAEEESKAVSLRIQPARLALSRLPGSLKLFDDRTGQHHRSSPPPPHSSTSRSTLSYSIPLLLHAIAEAPLRFLKKLHAAARHPNL